MGSFIFLNSEQSSEREEKWLYCLHDKSSKDIKIWRHLGRREL